MPPTPSRQRNKVNRSSLYQCLMMMWYLAILEHLVQIKLAKEIEERERDVGMDIVSEEDHPLVVILNGLHLEDEQYVHMLISQFVDSH